MSATDLRVIESAGVSVATKPAAYGAGYVGWAKRGRIATECPMLEPGEVWIGHGADRDALERGLLIEAGGVH